MWLIASKHESNYLRAAIQAAPHLTETCHLADINAKPMRTDKNKNEKKNEVNKNCSV